MLFKNIQEKKNSFQLVKWFFFRSLLQKRIFLNWNAKKMRKIYVWKKIWIIVIKEIEMILPFLSSMNGKTFMLSYRFLPILFSCWNFLLLLFKRWRWCYIIVNGLKWRQKQCLKMSTFSLSFGRFLSNGNFKTSSC